MRMKVQHETSIVVRKPSRETSDDAALQRFLRRKCDRMDDKIEMAPLLGDAFEERFQLARLTDIERHDDRRFQLARQAVRRTFSPFR